ncbi:MAG: hypothetical protein ABF812_16080, partial [Gluconobacter cerinus]|uniref:hypothetical protein n=3 Tax=Gluconobacter TaxID=441 RepID=UPI0039ED3A80
FGGCGGSDLASSIQKIISAMNGAFSSCNGWQASNCGSSSNWFGGSNHFGGSFSQSGSAWGCSTVSSHTGSQGCFSSTTQSASHSQPPVYHNTSHWGC